MNMGPMQIAIIALVVLIFFGRGRISGVMGEFGKGFTSFRRAVSDDEALASNSPRQDAKAIADLQNSFADKTNT